VVRVQRKVFEGTERGVAFTRIGGFSRTAHVQNHACERQVLCNIQNPLQLVHGFNAPDALHFGNRKRRASFPVDVQIAAGRRVQRKQLQPMVRQRHSHAANLRLRGVVEMTASGENFQTMKTSRCDLSQYFRRQLSGDE
jgi:hypothetical protein